MDEIMDHILSLSYGKDSLACLGAIEQLGWPLDRIIHAEVWATDTIPADLPPMVEFKAKADAIIWDRYGIKVEHIRHRMTYEEMFYRPCVKGKTKGALKGWPMQKGNWCLHLKVTNRLSPPGSIAYIGIAADEPARFKDLTDTKLSPLVEAGWTEPMCRHWCEKNGLLSPIYSTATRGGCWFCHNQGVEQLRHLRSNYPELWEYMLHWDAVSPVTFKAGSHGNKGHTVHDFDLRFLLEDAGIIQAADSRFKWADLELYDF